MSLQPFFRLCPKREIKSENFESGDGINGVSSEIGEEEGREFNSKLNELGICNNLKKRQIPLNGRNVRSDSSSESPAKFHSSLLLLRSLEEQEEEEEEEVGGGRKEEGGREEEGGGREDDLGGKEGG